jgi:hypothetical protein
MALFFLCNNLQIGGRKWYAGRQIDDTVDPAAAIRGAGGLLWPSGDAVVAAAATRAQARRRNGIPPASIAKDMMAAVESSMVTGGVAAGVQKVTTTIGFAQLTAAALTQSIALGTVLPANARILTRELRLATPFSGGAIGSTTASVGLAGGTEVVNAANVFTGAPAAQKGPDGVDPFELLPTGGQLQVTFTSTVANVNAATAGALTIDVMYIVAP